MDLSQIQLEPPYQQGEQMNKLESIIGMLTNREERKVMKIDVFEKNDLLYTKILSKKEKVAQYKSPDYCLVTKACNLKLL